MPERYLNDRRLHRLSAEDFRAFVYALMWSVANRTDGVLEADDLALIPHFPGGLCATRLVAAEVWELHADGYFIVDFDVTQTSKHDLGVLENARRADRESKARKRAAAKEAAQVKALEDEESPGQSTGLVHRTTQDRQGLGKDRTGRTGEAVETSHLQSVGEPLNDTQMKALASWGDVA